MARFPGKALATVLLVALMFPWAAALPSGPWGGGPARQEVRFALGSFDPLLDALPAGARLAGLDAAGPFVVQFEGRAGAARARAVMAAGGEIDAVLPHGAFVVTGEPGTARALARIDGVRWVGAVPAAMRLHPAAAGAALVSVSFGGGSGAVIPELRAIGANALSIGHASAVVETGAGGAAAVAALSHVLFVEPYRAPQLQNLNAVLTDGLRQRTNASAFTSAGGGLWVFNGNPADPRFLGYTGEGVVVDVTDDGVDGAHPAFSGRLGSATSWSGIPVWQDFSGHGTHVAASLLGDGSYFAADGTLSAGLYAGAAPGATLVSQNFNPSALRVDLMAEFAVGAGATISSNSWGDGNGSVQGAYTALASEYDRVTRDASPSAAGDQPLLFVFGAGNENNAPGSVNSPATAKNVLTVGAVGNDYFGLSTSTQVTSFSAFGPTDDLRIKPDLVAPGEMVASARSSMGPSGTGPFPPYSGTSYVYKNGTSMAAPQVSGAAAVATEYLRDARGVVATPALLKALLINGAEPLPGLAWPGPEQGWGRLNVSAALLNSPSRRVDFVPEGFATFADDGVSDVVQFTVSLDAGQEFRVSLVWTDHENAPLAPVALWNDLDLEVRDPTGSLVYVGNRINATTGFSDAGAPGHFDERNNVEAVRVQAAPAGNWSIFVRSYNFISAAQTFALAYSGAVNQTQPDLAVDAVALEGAPAQIDSGATVTVEGDVANHGGTQASGVVVEARNADDALAPPYATQLVGSLSPGARAPFFLVFQPPDGDNAIDVRARFSGTDGDPTNDAASLAFFVTRVQPQVAGATEGAALPGEDAPFAMLATNRGNVDDTLTLTEAAGVRDPAWAITMGNTSFALPAGATAAFEVSVKVPSNASLGALTPIELWLTSSRNASRTDSITLTARAGAVRFLVVSSSAPSLTVAPGAVASLPVHVTNAGNTPEEVDLSAAPTWSGGASWNISVTTATLPRGASADLFLTVSNSDTGAAGFRGDLRVRATPRSTGESFDLFIPVFLEARPCLLFEPLSEVGTTVNLTAVVPAVLRNCGNVRIAGPLLWAPLPGFTVEGPFWFDLDPMNSAFLDANVTATERAAEGPHTLGVQADVGGGLYAGGAFALRHRTQVDLVEAGPRSSQHDLDDGRVTVTVVFYNRGGAGPVGPRVHGVPAGWAAFVEPPTVFALAGQNVTFHLTVDAGRDQAPKTVNLTLVFYAGSAREGAFSPSVRIALSPAYTGVPQPTTPWPRSLSAGVAVLAGAILALAAAAVALPSRGLKRACPACGHKAPRFDTLLDPCCSHCGGSLERRPPS